MHQMVVHPHIAPAVPECVLVSPLSVLPVEVEISINHITQLLSQNINTQSQPGKL